MVVDAVRTYLDAANGLTELSRKEAVAAAKTLLRANGQVSPVAEGEDLPKVGQNIQALAAELVETSRTNREAIADLVRGEVTRQLETMDVVPRGEYERLARRVAELERRLAARHAVERALAPQSASGVLPVSSVDAGGEDRAPEAVQSTVDETTRTAKASKEPASVTETGEAASVPKKAPTQDKPKNTRSRSSGKRTTRSKGTTKK